MTTPPQIWHSNGLPLGDLPLPTGLRRFRKKPVIVEAWQTDRMMQIETQEGLMTADPGDWIIRGVAGEIYPCKPAIFAATYDPVGD